MLALQSNMLNHLLIDFKIRHDIHIFPVYSNMSFMAFGDVKLAAIAFAE